MEDFMHSRELELLGIFSSFIIFGSLGYYSRRLFSQPVSIITWILLIIGTFFVQYFAPSARILDAFGFRIYANLSIFAFGSGLLIGLIRHEIKANASNITMKT